jgi:hypothetical protein
MRMLLPPVRARKEIDKLLTEFFRSHELRDFQRAMVSLSQYYRLPTPKVTWFHYLDWGKTAGRTFDNGALHLVHPESWKRGRKYNSERQWVHMIYHEMGHYIFWADAERKADAFASRMVRGLARRSEARPPARVEPAVMRDRIGLAAVASGRDGRRRRSVARRARA